MPAPVASGWSDRRVALHPLEKRRLLTAHVESRHRAVIQSPDLTPKPTFTKVSETDPAASVIRHGAFDTPAPREPHGALRQVRLVGKACRGSAGRRRRALRPAAFLPN